MLEEAFKDISRDELYGITGNQLMEINTVFQLLSLKKERPELMERADTMLLMPDLFNYLLCGAKKTEYSIASTTQVMDAKIDAGVRILLKSCSFRLAFLQRLYLQLPL